MKNNRVQFPKNPWLESGDQAGNDARKLRALLMLVFDELSYLQGFWHQEGKKCPQKNKPPVWPVAAEETPPKQLLLKVPGWSISLEQEQ